MATDPSLQRLQDIDPGLERELLSSLGGIVAQKTNSIHQDTVRVAMRDGTQLATDLYLPATLPAPVIIVRTPYGRTKWAGMFLAFAQQGYAIVSQDCRGTGASEPDVWDYYLFEPEDSVDLVDWIVAQEWCGSFLGGIGGSYLASTQWCMAQHPRMSAIAPEVGGLGVSFNSTRYYMFLNAYARTVGKGARKLNADFSEVERDMLEETRAGGYFNEPLTQRVSSELRSRYPFLGELSPLASRKRLWGIWCALPAAQRLTLMKEILSTEEFTFVEMESFIAGFGHQVAYGVHSIPSTSVSQLCRSIRAPALVVAGWYDWNLNDVLATWEQLMTHAPRDMTRRSRLLITPSAHNTPGYHEGRDEHPELIRNYRTQNMVGVLLRWYGAIQHEDLGSWPSVVYYMMGANEWRVASTWPPTGAQVISLHLGPDGALTEAVPQDPGVPDVYTYDPVDPTPTVGGCIISYVYSPGSVDVSKVQERPDVLSFTTEPLDDWLDVVGSIRLVLYASSSAVDTDFSARLSDVFPDGRAIQLQSGMLRARYRNLDGSAELLEPGKIYRFEIDMWATANRFKTGHRIRLDICSADFPRFDRNTNRGGAPGNPIPAVQTIYHDKANPSHLLLSVLDSSRVSE